MKAQRIPDIVYFKRNIAKVHRLLTKARLWKELLSDMTALLFLPEDELATFYDIVTWKERCQNDCTPDDIRRHAQEYKDFCRRYGILLSFDVANQLTYKKTIQKIQYKDDWMGVRHSREQVEGMLKEAHEGRVSLNPLVLGETYNRTVSWKGKYDYAVMVSRNYLGECKGWLFRNQPETGKCSKNILLDVDHALFIKKHK